MDESNNFEIIKARRIANIDYKYDNTLIIDYKLIMII